VADLPDPEQLRVLAGLTPQQKLEIAWRLREDALRLKEAWLRQQHPTEDDASIRVLPSVEGLLRDPDLPHQICDRHPELVLLQHHHDLPDREPLPLHGKLPPASWASVCRRFALSVVRFSQCRSLSEWSGSFRSDQ
jgi:hypothetical protein